MGRDIVQDDYGNERPLFTHDLGRAGVAIEREFNARLQAEIDRLKAELAASERRFHEVTTRNLAHCEREEQAIAELAAARAEPPKPEVIVCIDNGKGLEDPSFEVHAFETMEHNGIDSVPQIVAGQTHFLFLVGSWTWHGAMKTAPDDSSPGPDGASG